MTFAELFDDFLNEYDAGLLNLPPILPSELNEYLEAAEWLNPSRYDHDSFPGEYNANH